MNDIMCVVFLFFFESLREHTVLEKRMEKKERELKYIKKNCQVIHHAGSVVSFLFLFL